MSDKSRLENNNLILQDITNTVMNMPNYIEIKNQDINITENGIYNADSGYTGLGTVTVNVSDSGGDVKQFDSIANMQTDPNPTEGNLAIVYYSTGGNLTAETEFQTATFPETVALPSAVIDYISIGFKAVDESVQFDSYGSIMSDRFELSCYAEEGGALVDYRIQYESSDGINYTRTRFMKNQEDISGNEIDFGTLIVFGSNWGGDQWDDALGYFIQVGVTEFNGLYQYSNNSYSLAPTQFTADNRYVFNKSFYGINGIDIGTLQNVENLTLDEVRLKAQVFSDLSYLIPSNNVTNMSGMFTGKNLTIVPNFDTSNVTNMSDMFEYCNNLTSVPEFNTINVINMYGMFRYCSNLTDIPNFDTSNVTNMCSMFSNCYNLRSVSNFNISNASDIREMFLGCSNLHSVPNFDTSNIVSMYRTFYNCTNLVDVSEFNMSKVTHAYNLFYGCNNLSSNSYANIANSLPLASKLGNQYVSSLGLNIENFTIEQKQILGNKQYIEAISYTINTSNVSSYWNIYYV